MDHLDVLFKVKVYVRLSVPASMMPIFGKFFDVHFTCDHVHVCQ